MLVLQLLSRGDPMKRLYGEFVKLSGKRDGNELPVVRMLLRLLKGVSRVNGVPDPLQMAIRKGRLLRQRQRLSRLRRIEESGF